MSGEQTVETYEEPDEEKIQEMLDFEEDLLQERREAREEQEEPGSEPEPKTEVGDVTTATIRNVHRRAGYRNIAVEFLLEGEMMEDTIQRPSDPLNPDEEINRLCRFCGVEPGRVSELQSKEVPVKRTENGARILLPKTTALPARGLFRIWLAAKQYKVPRVGRQLGKVALGVGGFAFYLLGLYALRGVFISSSGDSTAVKLGTSLPWLGPEAIAAIPPFPKALLVLLVATSATVGIIGTALIGIVAWSTVTGVVRDYVYPF